MMSALLALLAVAIVLVVGDFASTFFYHVPQHVWFKLHLRYHHDNRRSFWDHAIVSRDFWVLLDGFYGAVPYIIVAAACWRISPVGAIIGLVVGEFHVWWRHTAEIGWRSPAWFRALTRPTGLVLPEDHNGHHKDPETEFGDIFRFYDAPARVLIAALRAVSGPRAVRVRNAKRAITAMFIAGFRVAASRPRRRRRLLVRVGSRA